MITEYSFGYLFHKICIEFKPIVLKLCLTIESLSILAKKKCNTMAIEKFNKYMFIGNFVMFLLNIVLMAIVISAI